LNRRVVIHVGLHKTASTFLQRHVWPRARGYTCVTRPYTQLDVAFNKMQYADDTVYEPDELAKTVAAMPSGDLLLSDESFSGKPVFFSYVNRSLIAERLRAQFPQAEILLFLRDQRDVLLSHDSSYIRMPYGVKRAKDFFYRPPEDGLARDARLRGVEPGTFHPYYDVNDFFVHLDGFKYSALVDLYRRRFPRTHVFLYEDLDRDLESVLSSLEGILGSDLGRPAKGRTNPALGRRPLEAHRRANRVAAPFSGATSRRIVARAARLVPVIRAPDPLAEIETLVGDFYRDDNARLKRMLPEIAWEAHPGRYE